MTQTAATSDLQSLYRDRVLEHARNPRNFGRPADATHSAEGINPLCGDKLHLYLTIGDQHQVVTAQFEGSGCAISIASASLLTEAVADLNVSDAQSLSNAVTERLAEGRQSAPAPIDIDGSDLRALDGVRNHPARIKCATLAWQTLLAALTQKNTATTE